MIFFCQRHVVFVQAGDFRDAVRRINVHGEENYHAQRYSVDIVRKLVDDRCAVAVICVGSADPYDEVLSCGVRAIGVVERFGAPGCDARLIALMEALKPTDVVLRSPNHALVDLCLAQGIRLLPCFADSFTPRSGLRRFVDILRAWRLGRALCDPRIRWVSNHNIPASRDLVRIGVPAHKIVPWDWPRADRPEDCAPKRAPQSEARLLCLGAVSEAKGVGDAIRALAGSLRIRARARLSVVGGGAIDEMRALAAALGVADRVDFVGRVPFPRVIEIMRDHDILIVYSRPEYGEGMPGTIYQGFAARTPIVMSRHPVFVDVFADGVDCVFADPAEPDALARALLRLLDSADLYSRISTNSASAFAKIEHPVLWGDVISNWLNDDATGDAWLRERRLDVWTGAGAQRAAAT